MSSYISGGIFLPCGRNAQQKYSILEVYTFCVGARTLTNLKPEFPSARPFQPIRFRVHSMWQRGVPPEILLAIPLFILLVPSSEGFGEYFVFNFFAFDIQENSRSFKSIHTSVQDHFHRPPPPQETALKKEQLSCSHTDKIRAI